MELGFKSVEDLIRWAQAASSSIEWKPHTCIMYSCAMRYSATDSGRHIRYSLINIWASSDLTCWVDAVRSHPCLSFQGRQWRHLQSQKENNYSPHQQPTLTEVTNTQKSCTRKQKLAQVSVSGKIFLSVHVSPLLDSSFRPNDCPISISFR